MHVRRGLSPRVLERVEALADARVRRARSARRGLNRLSRRSRRGRVLPQRERAPQLRAGRRALRGHAARRARLRRDASWPSSAPRPPSRASARCSTGPSRGRRTRRTSLRVGLAFNMKRIDSHGDDREAEYDSPKTIQALTLGDREPRSRRRAARSDRRFPARADDQQRRRRLQHRRGDQRAQPRGAGPEPLRAARHPLHGQRLGDAQHLPRQGAVQAPAARHPDARVPAASSRAARNSARSATPSSSNRTPRGRARASRARASSTTRHACARSRARSSRSTASRRSSRSTSPGASSPSDCSASGGRACCLRWRWSSCTRATRAGLRLRLQAGLGEARALRVPAQRDQGGAARHREGEPLHVHGPRLPGRRPRRPAPDRRTERSTSSR